MIGALTSPIDANRSGLNRIRNNARNKEKKSITGDSIEEKNEEGEGEMEIQRSRMVEEEKACLQR
jgi:hypothetical protein